MMSEFFYYLSLLLHVFVPSAVYVNYLNYPMLQSHIVSDYLLLNLRSPRDYVVRSSVRPSVRRACGMC